MALLPEDQYRVPSADAEMKRPPVSVRALAKRKHLLSRHAPKRRLQVGWVWFVLLRVGDRDELALAAVVDDQCDARIRTMNAVRRLSETRPSQYSDSDEQRAEQPIHSSRPASSVPRAGDGVSRAPTVRVCVSSQPLWQSKHPSAARGGTHFLDVGTEGRRIAVGPYADLRRHRVRARRTRGGRPARRRSSAGSSM